MDRFKDILAQGFAKAFARLVMGSSDTLPHAGLYIYGDLFRALTQQKRNESALGWRRDAQETTASLLNHSAPASQTLRMEKMVCLKGGVKKKKNSFQAHTEIVFLTIKKHFQIFRCGGVF